MIFKSFYCAIAISFVTACGPTNVVMTPEAQRLSVVTADQVNGCALAGMLASQFGANFMSFAANVENATNDILNKAAARGATHVVLGEPQKTDSNPWASSGCQNCVVMTGRAYRCTAPAADSPSPRAQ